MLSNDSSTVAVEIPIWLTEDEINDLEMRHGIELVAGGAPRSITGHIDFLQVRNDAVHILDYKPDARTNKPIAQLAIYALALTVRVPGLKLFDIKCAWFNEEEYNEFFLRTLFAKRPRQCIAPLRCAGVSFGSIKIQSLALSVIECQNALIAS
jgi:hypothetical protein